MDHIYENILGLMGKAPSDPAFDNIIAQANERPEIFLDNSISTEFRFRNSGFELAYMKGPGCFSYAFLHIRTPSVLSGKIVPFVGALPASIQPDDSLSEVRSKFELAFSSIQEKSNEEEIEFTVDERFLVTFSYRAQGGLMSMISLAYSPANDWVNERSKLR